MLEQQSDNRCALIRNVVGLFAISTALLVLSAGAFARDVDVTVTGIELINQPVRLAIILDNAAGGREYFRDLRDGLPGFECGQCQE